MSIATQASSKMRVGENSDPHSALLTKILLVCMTIVLLIIGIRIKQDYVRFEQSNSVSALHLRSLDGYLAGTPVFIGQHLPVRPKGFVVLPLKGDRLAHQASMWSGFANALPDKLFPILVCMETPCPADALRLAEANHLLVLDSLQYIPALAVNQSFLRNQVLVLDASMIVRAEVPMPTTLEAVTLLAAGKRSQR